MSAPSDQPPSAPTESQADPPTRRRSGNADGAGDASGAVASAVYVPIGSSGTLYSPEVLDVVERIRPVSTFLMVTVAPATAAPLESVTVPKIVPRKVWPHPGAAKIATNRITAQSCRPRAHHG